MHDITDLCLGITLGITWGSKKSWVRNKRGKKQSTW